MSRAAAASVLVVALVAVGVPAECQAGPVVAIVNADNPAPSLSLPTVRRIFQAVTKEWSTGYRVVLLLPPPESAAMDALVRRVLVISGPDAVASYYLKAIFQGRLSAMPIRTSGTADAVAKVMRHRGAIVLADRAEVPPGARVRIIEVDDL